MARLSNFTHCSAPNTVSALVLKYTRLSNFIHCSAPNTVSALVLKGKKPSYCDFFSLQDRRNSSHKFAVMCHKSPTHLQTNRKLHLQIRHRSLSYVTAHTTTHCMKYMPKCRILDRLEQKSIKTKKSLSASQIVENIHVMLELSFLY